jgi:hypothetical protein
MVQPAEVGAPVDTGAPQDTSVIDAPPAPQQVVSQSPPQASAPTAPQKLGALAAEIRAMAQVDMSEVRKLVKWNWLSLDGMQAFDHGKKVPLNTNYTLMAMFRDDKEVRAYAAPVVEGAPYVCFVLTRDAPSYGVEQMSLDVFKNEVADELSELASGMERRELGRLDEREDVVAFLRSPDAAGKTVEQLAAAIEAEEHIEGEEEV